jgi:tetratricopeptide (TPR) repeat protein
MEQGLDKHMSVELPGSYESLYNEALKQMTLGNGDQAIESMLRIVNRLKRLKPEALARKQDLQDIFVEAWQSAVEFMRWQERYDEAIRLCESVIDHLPDPSIGQQHIAFLMIDKGQIEAGLQHMQQIAQEHRTAASWLEAGSTYAGLERYAYAETCFKAALASAGSNDEAALANVGLLQVYQGTDQVDRAIDAWRMAVVLRPELADQVYALYAWLIERRHLQQAQVYLAQDRNPIRNTFHQGLIDWQSGRREQARSKWHKVLAMDASDQESEIAAQAEAALRLGEPDRAIEMIRASIVEQSTANIRLYVLGGIALLLQNDLKRVQTWFTQSQEYLRRIGFHRKQIPAEYWALVQSLVPDPELQKHVAAFFDQQALEVQT